MAFKVCSKCKKSLSFDRFSPDPRGKFGLYGHCKDCHNELSKNYRERSPDYHKNYRTRKRQEVVSAYGAACACCGEARYEFLAIDHVAGGGKLDRQIHGGSNLVSFLNYIIKKGFPKEYRLLCHNCNMSRGFLGYCPHEYEDEEAA